jgi:hypothetical protein
MAFAIPYKEVRVGDEPIEVDSSVAINAIKNGATEFTLGAYHVCDVQEITFDTHIPMTIDGQDYGWFEDDQDLLIEGHLCDTEQTVVMAIDDDNLHGSISISDGTEVTYSSQGTMSAHHATGHEFSDDDTMDPFLHKRQKGQKVTNARARRKLQTLEPASVDVHVKLEIDSDMVTFFGSEFAASRYGVELMALANQDLYHATGFNLVVSQINVRTSRITSTASTQSYLYAIQETPLPVNVNLAHALSTRSDMSGGIAFVGGLYSAPYGYGVSVIDGDFGLWDRMVMAHEIGHNFGSGHTHTLSYYDPLIDNCGNDAQNGISCGPFSEVMSTMSYCHLCSGGLNNMFPMEWGPRVEQEILDIYWESAGSWLASNWACDGFDSTIPGTGMTFVLYGGDATEITCLSGNFDASACGGDCALNSCESDAFWYWDEGASRIRSGKDVNYCWEVSNCDSQSGLIYLAACSSSSSAQGFTMSASGVSSTVCGALSFSGTDFTFTSGDPAVEHWCLAGADPTTVDTDGDSGGDSGGDVSTPTGICEDSLEMLCDTVYTGSTGAPSGVQCWTFTAPNYQSVTFTSCGSSYDTMMEILDASGNRIHFGDDTGDCGYQTILEIDVDDGMSYTVKLSGYNNAVGAYQMEAVCATTTEAGEPADLTTEEPEVVEETDEPEVEAPTDEPDTPEESGSIACGQTVSGSTVGRGNHHGNVAGDAIFTFVAGAAPITFDACESSYDSYLRVFDANGNSAGYNDDHGSRCTSGNNLASYLEVSLNAGATYTLVVEGYSNNEGDYVVSMICGEEVTESPTDEPEVVEETDEPEVEETERPTDEPDTPQENGTIACGQTVSGSTVGRGNHHGNVAGDAIFTFVATNADITFEACDSDYDSYLRLYDASGTQVAYNDDHRGRCGGTNSLASHLEATVTVGQSYTIVVDGFSSEEGSFVLTMLCGSSPPPQPESLTISCGQTVSGSTVGASSSVGSSSGEHIYSFAATTSDVTFDACDSDYDSYLRLMDANLASTLASNDDHGGTCGSGARWSASKLEVTGLTIGTTYNIVIEGFSSYAGAYVLGMSCPAGDTAGSDTDLCGTRLSGSTVGEDSNFGNAAGEMTYDFVASGSNYIFDACGSNYDSYLRVYDSSGHLVGYNDDHYGECSGSGLASHLQTSLVAGNSYTLVVEGYGSNEGDFVVDITCPLSLEGIHAEETLLQHTQQHLSELLKPLNARNPIVLVFALLGALSLSIFTMRACNRQKDYEVVLDLPEI